MSNLITLPLEDWFETSLSQAWDWATWTVYVAGTPNFTFPSWVTTYITVNPWKSNVQVAEINAYDSSAKTLTVNNITLEKWASVNSTAQSHAVWSKVIISDNFQFWEDIQTAINSKVDESDWQVTAYADATARDAAITSPANWMQCYLTDTGKFSDYTGGSWTDRESWWTFANASTTVAWKVEIATDAEVTAWTWTWWTWAVLSVTPTQANKLANLATTDTTFDDTDYFLFSDAAASDVNKKITIANSRDQLAASNTLKWTSERATTAEAQTWTDDERYVTPLWAKKAIWSMIWAPSSATVWSSAQVTVDTLLVITASWWTWSVTIKSDSASTPTTVRATMNAAGATSTSTIPVRKDEYYLVEATWWASASWFVYSLWS